MGSGRAAAQGVRQRMQVDGLSMQEGRHISLRDAAAKAAQQQPSTMQGSAVSGQVALHGSQAPSP